MSISYIPEQESYKEMTPFRRFVLQSFPWIDANFDALTNYELIGKIVEYLNDIISNENAVQSNVTALYNAFVSLQNYVNNYFDNLDVQDEINNKLDDLVLDGTLRELLEPYTQIIFVSTTSEMEDISKIYVLSTNNHIYQYNETSETFVDTGAVFSSIDNVLTINATHVTTNNYETVLSDLDNAPNNSIYSLLFAQGADHSANMPVEGDSQIHTLFTITTGNVKKQIYYTNTNTYVRQKYGSQAWTLWTPTNGTYPRPVTDSNYSTIITDLNNINEECTYIFLITNANISNYPITNKTGDLEMLITKKLVNTSTLQQLFFTRNQIYTRRKYNNAWSTWYKICGDNPTRIQASNYATLLPDIDSINETSVYSLLFASGTDSKPAHLPIEPSGKIELLLTYKFLSSSACQIYYTTNDIFYRYQYNGTWQSWNSLKSAIATAIGENYDVPKIIHVGTNQAYTTLKSAVEYAVQYANTTVIVEDGTYDLYEEFGGDTFFDEYTSTSTKGLTLSNGIHLIFSSNAKVVFNNENENTEIDSRFSPFNSGSKGFTIENLHLECSRCRYAIHDERGGSTERYRNVIKNSYIKHDNTNGGFTQTIGGGLGKAGEIIIENCEIVSPNASDSDGVVSYHNNNSATDTSSKSNVIIKDNYFTKGTIRVSWCGVSTLITNFLITNNKLNSTIIHSAERSGTDTIENTSITKWNNIES